MTKLPTWRERERERERDKTSKFVFSVTKIFVLLTNKNVFCVNFYIGLQLHRMEDIVGPAAMLDHRLENFFHSGKDSPHCYDYLYDLDQEHNHYHQRAHQLVSDTPSHSEGHAERSGHYCL